MIYICLILIVAMIIVATELIRRYSKKYRTMISFRESFDLTGLPVITFTQGKNKLNFLFDTGATNSVIDSRLLEKLKYDKVEGATCDVYGMEGNVQSVNIVEIQLEKNMVYSDLFQVVDMSSAFDSVKAETGVLISGILGGTFFQKYKYVLDYSEMKVYSKA